MLMRMNTPHVNGKHPLLNAKAKSDLDANAKEPSRCYS